MPAAAAGEAEQPRQLWLDVERPILARPRRPRPASPDAATQPPADRQMELRMVPASMPVVPIPKVAPGPPAELAAVASGPARQPFGAWLLDQAKRPGLTGELAKAVRLNRAFPKNGSADAVRACFASIGADGDAFMALDDAETEYDRLS
jgi:hypothetical protein